MKFIPLFFACIGLAYCPAQAQVDPPLSAFGHGSMKLRFTEPASGVLKCLVILVDDDMAPNGGFNDDEFTFSTMPGITNANAYYRKIVFDLNTPRNNATMQPSGSVNGYLIENSKGAFFFTPATGTAHPNGVIGPLAATQAQSDMITISNGANQTKQIEVALDLAVQNGFVLKDFDADGDGVVTETELFIIVIKANQQMNPNGDLRSTGGENRGVTNYSPPGQPANHSAVFSGRFVGALEKVDFATLAHEVTHSLGTNDIYSIGKRYGGQNVEFNSALTLMGETISSDFASRSFHLDCWHKMALGWTQPRIVSMKKGGIFTIPAAQTGGINNPLLLYDPDKGSLEYFMIEYRTSQVNAGQTYDGQLRDSGVLLWHIQMAADFASPGVFQKRAINITSPWELTQFNGNNEAGEAIYVDNDVLNAVWTEGPPLPNGDPRINTAWQGAVTSPRLEWNAATTTNRPQAPCYFYVHPFAPTDTTVTVEIFTTHETWVDFYYNGPETGDFATPYNLLQEGIANVGWKGKLRIKSTGTATPATPLIDKPMTISAEGGPVLILQP